MAETTRTTPRWIRDRETRSRRVRRASVARMRQRRRCHQAGATRQVQHHCPRRPRRPGWARKPSRCRLRLRTTPSRPRCCCSYCLCTFPPLRQTRPPFFQPRCVLVRAMGWFAWWSKSGSVALGSSRMTCPPALANVFPLLQSAPPDSTRPPARTYLEYKPPARDPLAPATFPSSSALSPGGEGQPRSQGLRSMLLPQPPAADPVERRPD